MGKALVILWVLGAIGLLLYNDRLKQRERLLLRRMRDGNMYARLYHKVDHLIRHYDIDQVRIEQHGVTVTSVYPAHTLLNFDFKQNGNSKRCDAVPRLVAQLLAEDFPALAAHDIYRLNRYRVYRANGRMDYGFSYTMRRRVKDAVIDQRGAVQLRIL